MTDKLTHDDEDLFRHAHKQGVSMQDAIRYFQRENSVNRDEYTEGLEVVPSDRVLENTGLEATPMVMYWTEMALSCIACGSDIEQQDLAATHEENTFCRRCVYPVDPHPSDRQRVVMFDLLDTGPPVCETPR